MNVGIRTVDHHVLILLHQLLVLPASMSIQLSTSAYNLLNLPQPKVRKVPRSNPPLMMNNRW